MAKSLRSKVKRRLRNCRAQHYYQTVGKQKLMEQAGKLHDPNYSMQKDGSAPKNAYLYPSDPNAVFPQTPRPTILDFRTHKMQDGGLTAVNVFRKHLSANSKKSKFFPQTRSAAELEAGADSLFAAATVKKAKKEAVAPVVAKKVTVAELTDMTSKMAITKQKKAKKTAADVEMKEVPKIAIKTIKKRKEPIKRSRKQLLGL